MPTRKKPSAPAGDEVSSLDFEQALAQLEGLVSELEKGEQPLEQALGAFERGVALARRCQAALRDAEQKVEILSRDAGEPQLQPFEPEQ